MSPSNGVTNGVMANGHTNGTSPSVNGQGDNNGTHTQTNGAYGHIDGDISSNQYDLICVGFGPASLAIAVALHDSGIKRRVIFLERQAQFAWHSGMLLPSAKMQISFLKDLATFRDPRSHFTFLNYLHSKDRLALFTNLSTFLPRREEFNDYLTWAASHFDDCVRYGSAAQSIEPVMNEEGVASSWKVTANDIHTEEILSFSAKNVVIAVGGFPKLPRALDSFGSKIIHSSQYLKVVPDLIPSDKETRVAVVGGGQSAAEIFEDLMNRYPHVHASLFTAQAALKPSDDSPFVNEIFDPQRVDEFYNLAPSDRRAVAAANRATNYSVVRPELLERLYEKMYAQKLHSPDERDWQHHIVGSRELVAANEGKDGRMRLTFRDTAHAGEGKGEEIAEDGYDLVITGTGYVRNAHEQMLKPVESLFQEGPSDVERDYRLMLKEGAVEEGAGIWLQGCCEQSHGLSDSLLSVLAVRGGEIVDSIFGERVATGHANGTSTPPKIVNGKSSLSNVHKLNGLKPSNGVHANGTNGTT